MKRLSTLPLLLTAFMVSGETSACNCDAGEDKQQWLKDIANEASYVFFAKVVRVDSKTHRGAVLKESAVVEIRRQFKGNATFSVIESVSCASRPNAGEERIFFIDSKRQIIPCTNSEMFFDIPTASKLLEGIVKTNDN